MLNICLFSDICFVFSTFLKEKEKILWKIFFFCY
nr:MAG TPA: hypothetical protein [Caudoviricetes sp.]